MTLSSREFLHRLYKRVTLGKVQKKISLYDLKKESYASLRKPVFVLSTGRCRTHWLSGVISAQRQVHVEHNPDPTFLQEGKLLYENAVDSKSIGFPFSQLVFTARDHYWLDCAKRNLRYIETNNRITFAVPILKQELKEVKFLHLTRDPIDFIISGRNRNWYRGDSHDLGRITMNDKIKWAELNLNQKIGWLWYETNRFILDQTRELTSTSYYFIASEDLNMEGVKKVLDFLDLDATVCSSSWFKKPTNTQSNALKLSKAEIITDLRKSDFYIEINAMAKSFGYSL